jgi:thiol-disulfide isomerase/thioredoxin
MKKIYLLSTIVLSAALFTSKLTAQNAAAPHNYTFNFYEGTFADGVKEATKKKKFIFIDAYTTWCGPCKMMNSGPFKDEAAGKFFNENFINMKIDMEKGEGPQLAMKYSVRAYPTLIFLNSKGEEVHRALGYHDAARLIEQGKLAIAKK